MEAKKMCPSAPYKKGYSIFAEFQDGSIEYLDELKPIGETNKDRQITGEFRATMSCVTKSCVNWANGKCTVPDQMRYLLNDPKHEHLTEKCAIRTSCRWFAQDSYDACKICPLIKTKFYGD